MKLRLSMITPSIVLVGLATLPLLAQERPKASGQDEFFIISSVDIQKKQVVFKRPTEVTVLMEVNEKTVYSDEQGKPLQLKDLRAGDTVYVRSARTAAGTPLALRIRLGPMTVEEMHRRYLRH